MIKLTVKRLYRGCGLFWVGLACFVLYSCHAVPVHAAEQPAQCISAKDSFGTSITQCMDGTVTIVSGNDVKICAKGLTGEVACQKV